MSWHPHVVDILDELVFRPFPFAILASDVECFDGAAVEGGLFLLIQDNGRIPSLFGDRARWRRRGFPGEAPCHASQVRRVQQPRLTARVILWAFCRSVTSSASYILVY